MRKWPTPWCEWLEKVCQTCGKAFKLRASLAKWNPAKYCSQPCVHEARRVDGGIWTNPVKIRQYHKRYAAKNKAKINALSLKWARNNPDKKQRNAELRRARKFTSEATLTKQEWMEILASHGGKCAHCGTDKRIEKDHIIPLTKGGTHTKDNIQPLCRICNAGKGNKIPPECKALFALDVEVA